MGTWSAATGATRCGHGEGHAVPAGDPIYTPVGKIRRCRDHTSVPVDYPAVAHSLAERDGRLGDGSPRTCCPTCGEWIGAGPHPCGAAVPAPAMPREASAGDAPARSAVPTRMPAPRKVKSFASVADALPPSWLGEES